MINRRQFLKVQGAALTFCAASTFVPGGLISSLTSFAQSFPDVVVVKGRPAQATREAVNLLGGMGAFVKPGQKVVIKPNMSFVANVDSAANTHPEVVAALAALCREAGASSVLVLDHAFQSGNRSLEASGILAACESIGVGICRNVTQSRNYQEADFEKALQMRGNAIIKDVLEADVLIAAPVAKTNSSTGVSLSVKGQMGLILDRNVMHYRYDLDTAIVDLCQRLKPSLVVIDASRVLASNGPYGPGTVLRPGEIIASRDPVAADAMAVASYQWYGRNMKPRQVGHLVMASKRGLGRIDVENMNVKKVLL